MRITAPSFRYVDGYPVLDMTVDGRAVRLDTHNKRTILAAVGAVYLGSAFEDELSVVLPAAADEGRPEQELHGFTDDPLIVTLLRRFLDATDDGTFAEGPVHV